MDDRNQPVGANLRRLLGRLRGRDAEEYGAYLEGQQAEAFGPTGAGRQAGPSGSRSMRETIRGVEAPVAAREGQPMAGAPVSVSRPVVAGGRSMAAPEGTEEAAIGSRLASRPSMSMADPEGTSEAAAAMAARRNARQAAAARPTTRMRPSASRGSEMSADDLNALSLARGVGADNAPDTAAAANIRRRLAEMEPGMKKGGRVKKMAKGGVVKVSAFRRGDGCATKGKTKGRMV